jgi:hypothetical protein
MSIILLLQGFKFSLSNEDIVKNDFNVLQKNSSNLKNSKISETASKALIKTCPQVIYILVISNLEDKIYIDYEVGPIDHVSTINKKDTSILQSLLIGIEKNEITDDQSNFIIIEDISAFNKKNTTVNLPFHVKTVITILTNNNNINNNKKQNIWIIGSESKKNEIELNKIWIEKLFSFPNV